MGRDQLIVFKKPNSSLVIVCGRIIHQQVVLEDGDFLRCVVNLVIDRWCDVFDFQTSLLHFQLFFLDPAPTCQLIDSIAFQSKGNLVTIGQVVEILHSYSVFLICNVLLIAKSD